MSKIHNDLNEKVSEVRRLQMELNRRNDDGVDDIIENFKRSVATLEKENARLKVGNIVVLLIAHLCSVHLLYLKFYCCFYYFGFSNPF